MRIFCLTTIVTFDYHCIYIVRLNGEKYAILTNYPPLLGVNKVNKFLPVIVRNFKFYAC